METFNSYVDNTLSTDYFLVSVIATKKVVNSWKTVSLADARKSVDLFFKHAAKMGLTRKEAIVYRTNGTNLLSYVERIKN